MVRVTCGHSNRTRDSTNPSHSGQKGWQGKESQCCNPSRQVLPHFRASELGDRLKLA